MSKQGWRWNIALALSLAVTAGVVSGCGDDAVTGGFTGFNGDVPEMSIDLELENGGLSAEAEPANFGDPYFSAYLNETSEVEVKDDPLRESDELRDMETRPEVEVKYLRVVWGNMRRGPEADGDRRFDGPVIDWTGGAAVTEGFLIPLRTLAFERSDYLVPPWRQDDPSRQRVEWVSFTGPGRDGVLFKIVVPAAGDDTGLDAERGDTPGDGLTEDDLFVFRTGPLTISFPLSGIAELDSTVLVDDHNGVSFTGFDRDDIDLCPKGSMVGAWVKVNNDDFNGGFFRARWVTAHGHAVGHVRGRWGVLPEGEKVFVGKIIGRDGAYLGHLRGHWNRSDEDPTMGGFAGRWLVYGADGEQIRAAGKVGGMWTVDARVENGGFMRGHWAAECARDAS